MRGVDGNICACVHVPGTRSLRRGMLKCILHRAFNSRVWVVGSALDQQQLKHALAALENGVSSAHASLEIYRQTNNDTHSLRGPLHKHREREPVNVSVLYDGQ